MMKDNPNMVLLGQGLGLVVMVILTIMLFTTAKPWLPLLDNANLLIHESGHVFFSVLGEFMGYLGGSIMQILVPVVAVIYFAYSNQLFSSGFALLWLGDSLINLSIYIKDARTMFLPLVNGGTHDWNWILSKTNSLPADGFIGNLIYFIGVISVLTGLALCANIFYKNSRLVRRQISENMK